VRSFLKCSKCPQKHGRVFASLSCSATQSLVLGPLDGYAIARHIEQISTDLLNINQGKLYPSLLHLEQEGAVASEWGASESNRKARFYRLTRAGLGQLQAACRSRD
jgi:DNA-binding PadR family transcriptional regulator